MSNVKASMCGGGGFVDLGFWANKRRSVDAGGGEV